MQLCPLSSSRLTGGFLGCPETESKLISYMIGPLFCSMSLGFGEVMSPILDDQFIT